MSRLLKTDAPSVLPPEVDELAVRRALVLDMAGIEPGGHFERLAAELGVSADDLHGWLEAR